MFLPPSTITLNLIERYWKYFKVRMEKLSRCRSSILQSGKDDECAVRFQQSILIPKPTTHFLKSLVDIKTRPPQYPFFILMVLVVGLVPHVAAQQGQPDLVQWETLRKLDLEQLMKLEVVVTSVAKKPQKLSDTPAAVFKMTADDIRRSGATSIPELLRMVPGIQVARLGVESWSISARGFNDFFANKLLVLIDGRSVYTPLFSGVYWDMQDTLLEDIDRIEVIRGSGGTVWGANAVNGVINIITKAARDTQGGLLMAGGGTPQELGFGGLRYGGTLSEDAHYRVFVKGIYRDEPDEEASFSDNWRSLRGGFRIDWDVTPEDATSFQGEAYDNQFKESTLPISFNPPSVNESIRTNKISGWHLLGQWQHTFSTNADFLLRTYFDHTERDESTLRQKHDTFDIDFRHRFKLFERHELIWGLGFRYISDHLDEDISHLFGFEFAQGERDNKIFSAFLQDEIQLADSLTLTVGSKFEHNSYSGFEVQPSARLLWIPEPRQRVWAAVTRAVRTPSRLERDGRQTQDFIPPETSGDPLFLSTIITDGNFDSETVIAYELGYRIQPHQRIALDIAAFYNQYERLRSFEFAEPVDNGQVFEDPIVQVNKIEAESYGVEITFTWQPMDSWTLKGSYSYLNIEARPIDSGGDSASELFYEKGSPHHQASLRSQWNLPNDVGFDLWLRYVDETADPAFLERASSYFTVDARLSWEPLENLELSLVGQNLTNKRHRESPLTEVEIERSFYGRVEWRF